MLAYDLAFGDTPDALTKDPTRTPFALDGPATRVGWTGPQGPHMRPEWWPISPTTGLPMAHVITLEIPPEYRRHGEELVALSLFAGEAQIGAPDPRIAAAFRGDTGNDNDPFLMWLTANGAHVHPRERLLVDVIDGKFALILLTREEFEAPRTSPPADLRRPGEWSAREMWDDCGSNAWDDDSRATTVWMSERVGDINVGRIPGDDGTHDRQGRETDWRQGTHTEHGYRMDQWKVEHADPEGREFAAWAERKHRVSHWGGTTLFVQNCPGGLTPWYLELEEFGPLNFGGGNCQIDMESGVFDWACG